MKHLTVDSPEYEQYLQYFIANNPTNLFFLLKKRLAQYEVAYVNEVGKKYFNEPTPNHSASSYFTEEVWNSLVTYLSKLKNNGDTFSEKIRLSLLGTLYTFNIQLFSIQTNEEQMICISMTEESTQLDQLVEPKKKYDSLLTNNLDSIIIINKTGEITYSNKAMLQTFGYMMKEIVGKSIYDFVEEQWINKFQYLINKDLTTDSFDIYNCLFFHKKGQFLPVNMKAILNYENDSEDHVLLIIRDTTNHLESKEKLVYLSYHDHLTGLWNRRALKEHLIEEIRFAKLTQEQLSILYIDLDRFKLINETLGYNHGDELLRRVAERLSNCSTDGNRLYRQNGDEFVFVVRNSTSEKAESFAKKILNELNKPLYIDHQEYFISASIGMSVFPTDGTELDVLLRKASQALLYVKERGRANYRFFKEDLNHSFSNEALLESHLKRAIELKEFSIHYQPQVDLNTNQINSFEALLRWNNPKFGFVPPSKFIPIAEESGLILQIGDWVLEQVCLQLRDWQQKGFRPVRIAVNISPKQFKMESFAKSVLDKLNKYRVKPSSLEVEITESAMTNIEDTIITLKELRAAGIVISIDDFGTGYSSLNYLKRYPVDIIKIDQSFIRDIELDEKNAAIAKTIIQLAHSLGLEVIAEGVEKNQEVNFLKEFNCQKAQGYFFSRPVPIEVIIKEYMTS